MEGFRAFGPSAQERAKLYFVFVHSIQENFGV